MEYKESEKLELKASFGEWKEIIISLAAFANKEGGTVVVGLSDDGSPLHLQIGKNTIEDFVNKLKHNTDPVLYPAITAKTFGLGEIIEIFIPKSDNKPVFAFDKAWIRVGKSNIKLSAEKIREFFLKYSSQVIDSQEIDMNFSQIEVADDVMQKLKNQKPQGKLSLAQYLCFTSSNKLIPQAIVKAARFKGNQPVHFLDARDFDQSLLLITDHLLDFIRKNIHLQYIIKGQAERIERWDYPMIALREAIHPVR